MFVWAILPSPESYASRWRLTTTSSFPDEPTGILSTKRHLLRLPALVGKEKGQGSLTLSEETISNLEKQVNLGKVKLDNLAFDYAMLEDEKSYLEEQNNAQNAQINTAYFVVASKSDLKKVGLLKSNLFSKKIVNENIDESLFTKIDVRKTTSIHINSKNPKILTNNPVSSYTLTENDDKTSTLTITDAKKFWNVSKYLIIQE